MNEILINFNANKDIYEFFTQVATMLIALLAFYVSVFQTVTTHRHNKKMVTPNLDVNWTTNNGENSYNYTIINNGIGPAVINKITYYYKGVKLGIEKEHPLQAILEEVIGSVNRQQTTSHIKPGTYFAQNDELTLIHLKFSYPTNLGKLAKQLRSDIQIVIHYKSIAGTKYKFNSHDKKYG